MVSMRLIVYTENYLCSALKLNKIKAFFEIGCDQRCVKECFQSSGLHITILSHSASFRYVASPIQTFPVLVEKPSRWCCGRHILRPSLSMQSSIAIQHTFCQIERISPHGLLAAGSLCTEIKKNLVLVCSPCSVKGIKESGSDRATQHYSIQSATRDFQQGPVTRGGGDRGVEIFCVFVWPLSLIINNLSPESITSNSVRSFRARQHALSFRLNQFS